MYVVTPSGYDEKQTPMSLRVDISFVNIAEMPFSYRIESHFVRTLHNRDLFVDEE